MNVHFIDKNGTSGVIQNDLSVAGEEPVSKEVHAFLAEMAGPTIGQVGSNSPEYPEGLGR